MNPEKYKLLTELLTRIKREYELDAIALIAIPTDPKASVVSIFNNVRPGKEADFLQQTVNSIRGRKASFNIEIPIERLQKDN